MFQLSFDDKFPNALALEHSLLFDLRVFELFLLGHMRVMMSDATESSNIRSTIIFWSFSH